MKTLISIYVRLIYAFRALKQIRNPHLGDIVYYQGFKYSLIQGVAAPYWDLFDHKDRIRVNSIHESKFRLQPLWCRFFFSFRFTYRFYMTSWYGIDVRHKMSSLSNPCKSVFVGKRTFKGYGETKRY